MMRREKFAIANIYVPIKRRATLKPETVQEIAQSILESDSKHPSWCGAMVIASSSYTVCIASKLQGIGRRDNLWISRTGPETLIGLAPLSPERAEEYIIILRAAPHRSGMLGRV